MLTNAQEVLDQSELRAALLVRCVSQTDGSPEQVEAAYWKFVDALPEPKLNAQRVAEITQVTFILPPWAGSFSNWLSQAAGAGYVHRMGALYQVSGMGEALLARYKTILPASADDLRVHITAKDGTPTPPPPKPFEGPVPHRRHTLG